MQGADGPTLTRLAFALERSEWFVEARRQDGSGQASVKEVVTINGKDVILYRPAITRQ